MWETFPTEEGGGSPIPTANVFSEARIDEFLVKTKNVPEGSKMINKPNFFYNWGFPNWGGGGGSTTWEFFPHNPVFFLLTTTLIHLDTTFDSTARPLY